MKIDLGVKPYIFPMPVLLIATWCEDGTADVMTAAWGGICGRSTVWLKINEHHRTSENLKLRRAFTLSMADAAHLAQADFFGIASGNKVPDKLARSGLTAVRSEKVDAPVIQELPLTLECRVIADRMESYGHNILGEIAGVLADEAVLDGTGEIDPLRLNAVVYDQMRGGYYAVGEKIGQAWSTGLPLMK